MHETGNNFRNSSKTCKIHDLGPRAEGVRERLRGSVRLGRGLEQDEE
jgi:hypothetical protein